MVDPHNSHQNHQKEVKVEDLLRLKRAERPDDAFWNTFDKELHQRMLQTLVKKDPWYVQLLRAVSGRIAQTTAVGAAAAFLALMVVRPAFVETLAPNEGLSFAKESTAHIERVDPVAAPTRALTAGSPVEVAMSDFDGGITPDYQIEAITAISAASELGYTQDYALDRFEVASYNSDAYVADSASFATSSVAAGLVY